MSSPSSPTAAPIVGIIGAGQLARMCQPPAVAMGITLRVLAGNLAESAAQVVPASIAGDYTATDDVVEFAQGCDVITFDHEHVPHDVLQALTDAGIRVEPRPGALVFAQDKLAMRRRLAAAGLPVPRWAHLRTAADAAAFADEVGYPFIAKTPRGGYDGKGVLLVTTAQDLQGWLEASAEQQREGDGPLSQGILGEEAVPFTRELAVMVARRPHGEAVAWPVVETVQTEGICTEVIAPAPQLAARDADALTNLAVSVVTELDVTGVMAVELFDIPDASSATGRRYVVNELAMRPHNSGHWTIEGSVTSQFEQHLRAVLDLPLGDTRTRDPWTVMGNVLGGPNQDVHGAFHTLMAADPALKVHLYGKDVRPGRKIGHVTVGGENLEGLRHRAQRACAELAGE